MTTSDSNPRYAIINLDTGELIDLKTFAREHIDPAWRREILRQAVQQVTGRPVTLPRQGDALASAFFAPPPESE